MTTTKNFRRLLTASVLAAALSAGAVPAAAQTEAAPAPAAPAATAGSLTVAIYAPTAQFPDSGARLAYVQGLAKAIQNKTGMATSGKAFVRYEDLKRANPDFAIMDGQCIAARRPGPLMAVAAIDGDSTQRWALFARGGSNLAGLKGKKLAYVKTGCRDNDFIENAMLDSEVRVNYFASLLDKPDVTGAVASVRDYKAADAVFVPASQGKGLVKVFETAMVPTPGFVVLNKDLPKAAVEKVQSAVLSYGAGGGIDGWKPASQAGYDGLAGRLGARSKAPIFAVPEVVRLDDEDIVVTPASQYEQASVRHHFWEPTK